MRMRKDHIARCVGRGGVPRCCPYCANPLIKWSKSRAWNGNQRDDKWLCRRCYVYFWVRSVFPPGQEAVITNLFLKEPK